MEETVTVGTKAQGEFNFNAKTWYIPFPRPVVRDKSGKLAKDYSPRDWYLKLQEEIFEVQEAYKDEVDFFDDYDFDIDGCLFPKTAEEIVDVITVCISWLETLGYDEEKRSEIFAKVNMKNEKRGYFKERD